MTDPIVKFITEREERIEEQSLERIGNNRGDTIGNNRNNTNNTIGEGIGNNGNNRGSIEGCYGNHNRGFAIGDDCHRR